MDWFRRHIRSGSRLALFALAVQFVLAFGHSHVAQAHPLSLDAFADAVTAEYDTATPVPAPDPDRHHHPLNDGCAICAVVAMAASAVAASSPLLHLPEAVDFLYTVTDAGFAHLGPSHGPFQPHGPPLS